MAKGVDYFGFFYDSASLSTVHYSPFVQLLRFSLPQFHLFSLFSPSSNLLSVANRCFPYPLHALSSLADCGINSVSSSIKVHGSMSTITRRGCLIDYRYLSSWTKRSPRRKKSPIVILQVSRGLTASVWRPYFTEYDLSIHPVSTAILCRIFALSRITQIALEVQCLVLEGPVHLSQNEDPGRVVGKQFQSHQVFCFVTCLMNRYLGLVRHGKSNGMFLFPATFPLLHIIRILHLTMDLVTKRSHLVSTAAVRMRVVTTVSG